jgi:class 3 adenylate cyclase/tetratricopeptide (TPR) repeat protein
MTDPAESIQTSAFQSSEVRTFLIADVRGYTRFTLEHGDEEAARLALRFAELTEEIVAAREGRVIELRGDEALAVFSSARRALRASMELQARFVGAAAADPSLLLKVGIGLDSGEAIPVAGGYRGAALNLAARLCSLAGPGEVLASEAVMHLARKVEGLEYAERGTVQLKGFHDLVKVIEIVPSPTTPSPAMHDVGIVRERRLAIGGFLGALPEGLLTGRETELGRILSAANAVAQGGGRLVLLSGEPGVGKTRLAQEVTLAVRNRGFLVATGRCYESHQTVPFYPYLEALTAAYAHGPGAPRDEVARRWSVLGRLLPNQGITPPPASSDGQVDQQRLFWAVSGFLQAIAAEQPLALMLDDLHWADSSSLELTQHLARHTRGDRVLLLATYRDVEVGRQHPLEAALIDLSRERLVEDIVVRRLDEAGTGALIATTFGQERVSAEFADLVHRQTEGNPFFTQEVLRALVERGDIYRENGHWERREIEEIEVPKSVRAVIGQRLSRLRTESQQILYEASVLGQTFQFDDLQRLGDRDEEELESALEEAAAAGLVRETGNDGYAFNHALTQQALYAELPLRRKRRLHLAAGEALEHLPDRVRQRRVAELARHFLAGDDPERALHYALLAGDQAEAVFAHGEGERHYRTALELARELGHELQEREALEKLGTVLGVVGRYDEALALLGEAAERYQRAGDVQGEIRVAAEIGLSHRSRGTAEEGIMRLQSTAERFEASGPSRELARFYATMERLFFGTGRYADELAAAERASAVAREVGDERVLALAEVGRGTALLQMLGRAQEGLQVLEDAIPLAERSNEPWAFVRILHNLSAAYHRMGKLNRAQDYSDRALAASERAGNPWGVAFSLANLGSNYTVLGRWAEAREYLLRGIEISQTVGASWFEPYPLLGLGRLQLAGGELEEARQTLEEGLRLAERNRDPQALGHGSIPLARLDLAEGYPEAAVERLEPLLDRVDLIRPDVAEMLAVLAEAHLAAGNTARAEAILLDVVGSTREKGSDLYLADALRVEGMLRTHQERWEQARNALEEALELARAMSYPYLEARILFEYGMLDTKRGEPRRARQRLEDALAIFRRLGASADLEQTQRELAQLR